MTDSEVLNRVLAEIDPTASSLRLLRRNGRVLLGLPAGAEAAERTLRLYQPQRLLARGLLAAIHRLAQFGLHGHVLPEISIKPLVADSPASFPAVDQGTCGVLLGSPEHRVRRAVASYRHAGVWEVAKVSFGENGARILNEEARVLAKLGALAEGIPKMLGLHHENGMTIMRMPYLTGQPIPPGDFAAAVGLLTQWVGKHEPKPITEFSEWEAIHSALIGLPRGKEILESLAGQMLRPVICHGDFARWNLLKQEDGGLITLDWEWGSADGMPGLDLVHYFLQDSRLVERLSPHGSIQKTITSLSTRACEDYLMETGWSGDPLLPILACLAYKQGAGHQENSEVLEAAVAAVP